MTCAVPQRDSMAAAGALTELYREAPDGVRVNMTMSLDGAAVFGGLAEPLSNPTDQKPLHALRGYADVVLVGSAGAGRPAAGRGGCEGGPMLLDELIAADLVDEMWLTISPTLVGESVASRRNVHLPVPARLSLRHAVSAEDYVYLRYARRRR